jgi:uncharacterized membrane protein
MEIALHTVAHYVPLCIEAIAIAMIAAGAIEALVAIVRVVVRAGATGQDRRTVWLRFARWLVAGLTFQLAADIVGTSFEPSWDELGRLASIAAIRTLLSFFLDRELDDIATCSAVANGENFAIAPQRREITCPRAG